MTGLDPGTSRLDSRIQDRSLINSTLFIPSLQGSEFPVLTRRHRYFKARRWGNSYLANLLACPFEVLVSKPLS